MESVYEALKQHRAQNNATNFAGMPVGGLQTARASLAETGEEDFGEKTNETEMNIHVADLPAHNQNAQESAQTNASPNTKSVMFAHLKQQEQQEQEQQEQEQQKQQEKLNLIRGIGDQQHGDKRDKDIINEYAKMRENPDLIAFKYEGKPMLATTREIFEIVKNDSIEEQIEFVKNAVNYTQSVEAAKKQGKSEAAFIKELGFPLSIKRERIDRLREEYMKNQKSLDYEKRNAHLKDRVYYNEIQEAFDTRLDNWLDNSGIAGAPLKFFWGLFGFASEGSIPVTKDQSVDEQILALQDESNKRKLMQYIHTVKSNFAEESLIGSAVSAIKGESKEVEERLNQRLLELLQEKMPSITKVGMKDGRFFVDFPDNQRIFFKDGFLTYLDTTIANNQMEAAAGIVAALVAAPLAAYAGAGAAGGFLLTTAAGAFGAGLGADMDFKRIAANKPIGTYTSEDRNAKILDAVALSIVGDTILGGAIYGAKAAWRAIPTAEKGGKRYAQKHSFFSEDVESKMATQDKYFTIDKAQQGFWGRLVYGGVKDEGFLNRLEVGLQSESVSPTAKRLSPVMNDTIADNVFDTNKKAQELFDSLLRGDHNRVAQLEKDIAEITQDLKNRFNALEDTLKEHVQITGAIPESFIEKVERDVARTISATDSRLHSTLDDIFGLMRNAGNVKDLIEIEKFVGQALVENYKHYSAKKILNHLQYNISKTIDDSIKSTFKNMPELGENLIKERAALKAEWRNFAFQKSRVGFDEMSQSFRQHQNLDNFVHAAQANVTHDDVAKGFAKEPQKRTSYSIGEKEMSESELESFLQTLGKGRENVELIVLNGIVHRAEKKIGKDFVVDNMSIYNDLKSINPDLFKSDKGRQAYQILDELATQFKHDTEILRFAGRDVASEEFKYWGMQPLVFKILSRFFNSLRARFSEEAGFRYCLQLAMERKRSFKEIGEILAEQSENPKLTPQDKHALLETSKLMLKTWQEREKEIAKKEAAEKKAREKLKKEKLARDKENLLKTSGDTVGEDILPTEDLGTRMDNADTMIFTDKDKGYAASYQIVDSNQLSTSFEYGTNYQFREIKQTETINHIRDNFDPKLIFTREGGFDGLPLVDNKGRTIVGNHRLEALQHLDDAHWESYTKEAFLKYGAKLERGQLLVRVLAPDVSLQERIAIAKASNDKRANTNSERNLIIIGKYAESINHLVNGKSPVQPAFKDAANVHAMRALVAAAMNEPLEKELTNRALLLYLCPDFVTRNKVLEHTMPDVAEIIQKMLDDNAGALFLNALSPNAKNIDISKYLSGALGRIAEARKFDKQRRERFLQNSVENLHIDFRNIYDSEQINGVSYFEQFKSDLIALALARFSKRDNPSENLYKFLKEIGETQEHSTDNLFGEEYATTLWDNLLRINRIDLENGEDAITLNIKKILEREKAYLAYKQQRELAEQQLEQFAFHNELLSSVQGKNALQFAMQTKMFGTQSEQNIAQEILAKQGYYLNHDGTLSLIEGKAKPKNPIETIREQAVRLYGDETPFMQDMREGWTNENIKQKWWIVPRGQHSIVEYAKEIDPNLVRFESAEVGSWFADFQGIVHKVAGKSQDMLMIEHHISNDIPPAKTWFFKNESQTTHLMQAYNGEVLLIDTFNNDNTRTILAKQHGKVFKTTIDENGTKETKEETAKSIELFSRFLQEDNKALETKKLKSTFQPLSNKEIQEIVSQWDLENPRAQDRIFVSKVEGKELEQIQKEFHFKGNYEIAREIDAQHIKHALNRHGDKTIEESRNQIPITLDEILDYQNIIKSADVREVSGKNIIYKKQINGHYVVVEEALTGKNKLEFVTMWKSKGNITTPPTSSSKGYDQDRTLGGDYDIANSTPPPINNSLKNSESVANVAEAQRRQQIAEEYEKRYPQRLINPRHTSQEIAKFIATNYPTLDAKTAVNAHELVSEIISFSLHANEKELSSRVATQRHELEQLLKIEPIQEFGTNYAEFYHNGTHAIQKVMQEKQGQVSGAFYREDLGDITITWGEVTDANKHKGYGLAHIVDKHPDMNVNLIAEIVEKGKLNIQNDVRARLEYGDYVVGLSREFKGEKVNFIITAFEKSNGNKGSLSPKPKITDESDNVSPTHTDDSTPPTIKDNLENRDVSASFQHDNSSATEASSKNHTDTSVGKQAIDVPTDYAVDIEIATELAARDKKQRLVDNLEALRTLSRLENGAVLDKEAQEALGKYSGFGGTDYERAHREIREILQNFPHRGDEPFAELLFNQIITTTKNAYYTPHEVISAIYAQLGFIKGRVLEPSMGIGNFFAAMPENLRYNTQRVGIELDSVSARIAQYLHPNARVENMNFAEFSDNLGFDLIIGNPPYEGKMNGMPIVGAFLKKSLELAKENGIVVQVVSNSFLDNPASAYARAQIAKNAELLGAVRLPSDTFSGTSVATDIVVFQKRAGGGSDVFVGAANHSDGTQSLSLNNYYLQHPEHILGTLRAIDTNYAGKRWSVEANESIERLPSVLESIFKNRFGNSDAIIDNVERQDLRRYTGKARTGSLVSVGENVYVVSDGDRFGRILVETDWLSRINQASKGKPYRELSEMGQKKRLSDSKKAQEMAKDYIALRDYLERLRKAEMENDVNMEDYREQLKECYDYFKRKHCNGGRISENRIFNAAFNDEPSYWLVRDLDLHNEHKILRQRVGTPIEIPTKAENLKDAIAMSKTYAGKIDAEFIETLLDDKAKVRQAFDEGELFEVKGEILTKDEYLSGDLGAKIDALEAKAELSPHEQNALKMLKESLPKPLDLGEIHYAPHSKWIPQNIMRDFLESFEGIKYQYSDLGGWEISKSYSSKLDSFKAATGHMTIEGYAVLQSLLNNKPLPYKKTIGGKLYTFQEQYIENQKARDRLLQYFYDFMQNHKQELENVYNQQFSRMLPRKVSAGHFLPPSEEITFFPHQKEALAFAMGTKNVLLDQTVGAGKTFEMIAMGAAFKRTGMAKRPAYTVPNHLVQQWAQSYHKLYPNANVITIPTETQQRKETLAQIANSDIDIDAIIIPHSTFNKITPSIEFRKTILKEEIHELDMAENAYRSQVSNPSKSQLTQLENKKKAVIEKLKALNKQQSMHNEENAIYFDDLKIDALFVDEAHLYKNIGFVSSNQSLRGLGSANASEKAQNLLAIVRQLQSRDGHVVFATGTPLSNSVSEVYAWQKYLAPDFLAKNDIKTFDDWLEQFGKIESKFERTPVGTYKEVNRLRGISNLDALSKSYAQFSYFTDVSQTHIKRPQVERVSIEVDCSDAQKDYMNQCLRRYQALQDGKTIMGFENDNYLNITNDGINCALDYRLIDKNVGDFEGSKINRAVSEAFKLYKQTESVRGVQLLFLDRGTPKASKKAHKEIQDMFQRYWEASSEREASLYDELEKLADKHGFSSVDEMRTSIDNNAFSLYQDMREKLIKAGVKEDEIAFIHDYTSDEAKAQLFARVRNGDVRFLIGSTKKMGAGMNVQDRIVGLHHIDAAWNPADLEQRDGRGWRQGNLFMDDPNFKLKIFYYLTKNSTDAIYYAKLEQKQASIKNFRSGHAIERNIDEQIELDYAEFAAAVSGDSREINKAQWQRELAELEAEKRGLSGRAANETKEKEMLLAATKELPKTIEQIKADMEIAKKRGKRELSEAELENLKHIEIEASNREPLFVLDDYEVFLEHNNIGNSYRLCAVSGNGHEILLRGWQQNPIRDVPYYARELLKQTTKESLAKRLEAKTLELAQKQERLRSLQESDFSQRLDELESMIAKTKEKLDNLTNGMTEGNAHKKEEFTTLENGTIVFKDTLGKEHTISKEIQEQWTKELGLASVEQDFIPKFSNEIKEALGNKEVKLTQGSLFKLITNKRTQYIPQIKETLEKPDVIIEHQDSLIFAKQIDDKKYFTSVGKDFETHITIVSNAPKKTTTLENKLKGEGKVIYQPSKLENLRYNQAFTDERFSTNKTDKANSTLQNIKNGLDKEGLQGEIAGNTTNDKSLQQQLQKLEQELATNRDKLENAMPEDKPKLREIHKELLQEKRRINAELGDTANATRDTTTLVQQIQDTFNFSPQKAKDLAHWHKESHSITKDEQGLPKVFYRLVQENSFTGRKVEFDVFSRQTSMKDIPNDIQDSAYGIAFYTNREDIKLAHRNRSKLYEVFLNIKKPLDLDTIITKENMAELEQLFKRNNEPKHLRTNIAEFENKPLIDYLIQKGFDQYPYSLMRKNEKGIHGKLDFNNLADFLSLKGYDSATKTIVGEGKIIYVFNPNQIKSIENRGNFNSSNNIYQSNLHIGSGTLTGSIAGIETDEQGNISFSPEKFVLGFLAGAAGSKAISSALQHLSKNKEHKKQAIDVIAQSLVQNVPDTLKKYPLLELVLPKKMSTSAQGLQAQTQTMISKLEQKEQRGLFNVTYNGKNATKIYKDLENVEDVIRFAKGNKDKGGTHIRLKHTTDATQEGYVKPQEVVNLGKSLREFLSKNEPFIDTNGARIYEWENSEKVRFRLVVNDTKREADSNPAQLPKPFSEEIITFYSDRNLKNPMQFKNPALRGI